MEEVHLVEVCTDICILHTSVDAYNLGYEIVGYKDAVASFNSSGHELAFGHFSSSLGARVLKNN
ncbi:isochorismatase family protein [Psychrobacillus sp. INOP01]|nr:isochorismatase family protein [Psychrobacillus sp. INOP01]